MADKDKVVNDLNVAKLILRNAQMLAPEMCLRVGWAITSAIDLLNEQEAQIEQLEHDLAVAYKDQNYYVNGGVKMSFADAVLAMNQGKRVRLPWWGGCWYIANGTLRIHCADDKDFDAFSKENTEPLYTLSFMTANCWEIVPD